MDIAGSAATMRARLTEVVRRPGLKRVLTHRDPGAEIAEMAVATGAIVAVGIGVTLAFMNGLGTFFTTLLMKIQSMVP